MSRLIDADELIQVLDHKYGGEENVDDSVFYLIGAIIGAPTIDAEPIRHGRWRDSRDTGVIFMECSVCKARAKKYAYLGAVGTNGIRYCPYCGAKMDEEAK